VVLAALKVLGAAAAIDQRSTFDAIAWTAKVEFALPQLRLTYRYVTQSLPKLLSHRHRTPTSQPLNHPSIRTALTTLVLALLPLTLPLDIFTALFRGLAQDDGVLVKLVLEACWEKIWCDVKVPKSLKVKVFGGLGIYVSLQNFILNFEPTTSTSWLATDPTPLRAHRFGFNGPSGSCRRCSSLFSRAMHQTRSGPLLPFQRMVSSTLWQPIRRSRHGGQWRGRTPR
jgi:hypothetical protein